MLSIQNYRITPSRIAFKSNENENSDYRENNAAVQPYKTRAGLKTGAWYAGIAAAGTLLMASGVDFLAKLHEEFARGLKRDATLSKKYEQGAKQCEQSAKQLKSLTKKMWITVPISILTSLACGMLVDSAINKKQAEFADKLNTEGRKAALNEEDRAEITKKENVYVTTSIGKKLGTMLGAVVLPALTLTERAILKIKTPVSIVTNVIVGAIGGLILGAITDKVANKGAAKHADKQVQIATNME